MKYMSDTLSDSTLDTLTDRSSKSTANQSTNTRRFEKTIPPLYFST